MTAQTSKPTKLEPLFTYPIPRHVVFPLEDRPEDEIIARKCNYEEINQSIMKRLVEHFGKSKEASGPYSKLSAPISKALCCKAFFEDYVVMV